MALYHQLISDEEMKALESEFISWRREIHENPCLSRHEEDTASRIAGYLESFGVEHEVILDGTSVVGIVRGGKPGPTVALRADIDALPIAECTGLPYASKNEGIMHACGHDVHATVLLGAAKVLSMKADELSGNVKFFFQPSEEKMGGAERMIAAGVLENPHVDYVVGLHLDPFHPAGTVGIKYDIMYSASDETEFVFHGKGAHGAHPEHGIDAIAIAAQAITNVQMVVSRIITPLTPSVCTFGTIEGGQVINQIADRVKVTGILRSLNHETRIKLRETVTNIMVKTAEMYGATCDVTIREGYGMLKNHRATTEKVEQSARDVLGDAGVYVEEEPEMGCEDFSYFVNERPGCFFHLGCAGDDPESVYELHNSHFRPNEDCILTGVKVQVNNVLTLLGI